MTKLSLKDLDLKGKTVVMRVDFNVPIKDGVIGDDNRIRQALPSINHVIEAGGKLVLLSHLGRPKGERKPEFSLKPVAGHLQSLVSCNVHFGEDCIGDQARKAVEAAKAGEIVVLENVRFHPEETKNDPGFSKQLAEHGDIFVNDAFGSSHRAHSSVAGITEHLQPAAAGYLLQKEIEYLQNSVENPKRPFVAVLGGAKVSDKIGVIENLITKVNTIIIGGGMTYTFYKAQGLPIGNSLLEEDKVELAGTLLEKAKSNNVNIMLPVDSIVGREFKEDTETKTVAQDGIEDGWMAMDIGPKSAELFGDEIKDAKTVIWNGPMGVFEMDAFAKGTFAVAGAMSTATENGAITIIGGGDSASAIKKAGLEDKVSHVSTGGGASLEYLEGIELPGIASLTDK
ncbi:phosphoglycerate kinase [Natronogracilivirga saccharolytica]|uniref:Phosphoglycerate kinase n=1 Tax=Natronogracilivirga saccharolytica TaxID=2812953 RepID=A0A8J7RJ77_9BACT|nr:phosphoglycerate kinase [Natronogracilivirga saccharolytica]MBP3191178.1 phosphoglycerate kinase [Natronogracilivirga saccharolytica]